jgi:hypothetical protein
VRSAPDLQYGTKLVFNAAKQINGVCKSLAELSAHFLNATVSGAKSESRVQASFSNNARCGAVATQGYDGVNTLL